MKRQLLHSLWLLLLALLWGGQSHAQTQVANLAELRTKPADGTTVYQVTGEVVLTYQQGFRNQKYVQDNTAGILIDDDSGVITTTYNVGDGITGLTGTLSVFGNMLQFVPTADPGAATSTGNAIVPVDITMNDFINNFEQYEARVVRINEAVNFTTSGTFANGQVYDFINSTLTGKFRTTFFNVDYIGQPVPSTPVIITGILNERSTGKYITARNSADFEVVTATATLTTSVSSLSDFGQVSNGQVSASQNYTLSGSNLSGNVTITAPANFEVSLDNTNFGSSVTLVAGTDFTGSTLNATTIYVRFAPSSGTNGVKTGNITHSSVGAVNKLVSVSGKETAPVVQVANLAELRSKPADGTTVYQVTGEVVLTYQQGFRNQKYVQDNTAGILIDDPGSPGKITTTYNVGDGITGLTGTLSEYQGMLQFVPTADPGAATSTGNAIVPVDITMDDFINNFEQYEARVVRINEEVTFTTSGTFANGQVYDFTNGTLTGQFRTTFYDMDYIGQPVPSTPVIITGILNERSTGKYITARNSADFEIVAPYVYYASTAGTVVEGKSKVVRIDFSEPAASASTIEITLGGPAAEGTDYSTTPAAASGVVTLSVNAGDSYAELTVDALDNANNDGDRSATFTITAASGGLKLDPDQAVVYTLTIADDELQVREIAEVQTLDNMGVSIFDGATVEVRGVVHGININQVSATSLQFALIDTDPLAGLQVLYNGTADLGYVVTEGDSVHVQGVVDNIDGMTVVVPSSIQKVGTGATMNPIELAAGTLLEEKYESQLVRLNKLQVVSGWGEVADGKDYWAVVVTDGNRDYIMRIDNDSDLFGTEAPAYTFSLTGLVMQDDATAPYDEGYQIMPRTAADLEADATTGVDAAFSAQVRVYPNPAAGNWTVDNLRGAWEWTLFNLQGERVAAGKAEGTARMQMNLPAGAYFLQIRQNERVAVKKLLVE